MDKTSLKIVIDTETKEIKYELVDVKNIDVEIDNKLENIFNETQEVIYKYT